LYSVVERSVARMIHQGTTVGQQNFKKNTTPATLCFGCSKCTCALYYKPAAGVFNTANNPAITAKRATPSTNAAVKIMFARMSLLASG
jgi:hypothetical protein